jgi:hypothetical protein
MCVHAEAGYMVQMGTPALLGHTRHLHGVQMAIPAFIVAQGLPSTPDRHHLRHFQVILDLSYHLIFHVFFALSYDACSSATRPGSGFRV